MYDMIFIRWVIGFVPDPKRFLDNLIPALKPGGVIVIQDYLYDGLALYPRGGAFDNAKDIVIRHWASGGGDAYIASRIPQFFRDAGLALIDYSPHCLAGDPESPVFEWAERFFTKHMDLMVESGATDKTTADAIIEDWYAHKSNPNAIFCSPIVVDMVGRKPIVEV
jgi:SAM-dependent methyltransferase